MPSRLEVLLKRRRNLLLALLLLLIAVAVTVGSLAVFSSSSASPGNLVATGSLSIQNDKEGTFIFKATGLVPGDSTTGTAVIENVGDSSGKFRLSYSNLQDSALPGGTGTGKLSTVLQLTITETDYGADHAPGGGDDTTSQVYSGTLNAMPALDLGAWPSGEKRAYKFDVTFPAASGNEFEGRQMTVDYTWDATS